MYFSDPAFLMNVFNDHCPWSLKMITENEGKMIVYQHLNSQFNNKSIFYC